MTIALYPTRRQAAQLEIYLETGRLIFNRALEQRISTYKETGKSLSRFDQSNALTQWRNEEPDLKTIPVKIERDAIKRIDDAFKAFFRRLKSQNGKAGFPRFKAKNRWRSMSISGPGKCVRNGRIRVSKIDGLIRCRNLRVFAGTIKVQRILNKVGKWYCQLVIEDGLETPKKWPIEKVIGIDVGLTHFATLSDGQQVENPRFLKKLSRKLRHAHQRISRRKKGSHRRAKAVLYLQKIYEELTNHRLNFTHHLSKKLINEYNLIAVEKLNVNGMLKGRLSKHILDAGWAKLRWQLTYKAGKAGCTVVEVNPKGTTQECSQCGQVVLKDLSERIHKCPYCKLIMCRDQNAARNILRRAVEQSAPRAGRAMRNDRGALLRPASAG